MSIVSSDPHRLIISYGTNDRTIVDPETCADFWMVSGLGMDDRCRLWRFRPSHNTRTAAGHKRFVRAPLRYLSVSIDSVAGKKKSRHHPVGLDSFLIIVLGRLVLKMEGRGTFLIDLSRCWKEGCF